MAFEDELNRAMFSGKQERTFADKVLAKDDVNRLRDLIRKAKLNREDMLEIPYLMSGTEAKLQNYDAWDRYVILKFFVWIRDYIKMCEILFDYEERLDKHPQGLTGQNRVIFDNCTARMQHDVKFLVDLYLNICRTSMSIGGTGFIELLKNKFEVHYPNLPIAQGVEKRGGFLGLGKR